MSRRRPITFAAGRGTRPVAERERESRYMLASWNAVRHGRGPCEACNKGGGMAAT